MTGNPNVTGNPNAVANANAIVDANAHAHANPSTLSDFSALSSVGVVNSQNTNLAAIGNTLYGSVSRMMPAQPNDNSDNSDNSYMVSEYGPRSQSDAAICSDVELGVNKTGVRSLRHDGRMKLAIGNVVFAPLRDTLVETPHGNVSILANSVVLVAVSDFSLGVYDLADQHRGSVTFESEGQKWTLAPGMHLTVAAEEAGAFAQVNAFEAISHRNLASRVLKPGTTIYTSEFSALTAIATVKPLQALTCSQQKEAKKVTDKMLKIIAILMTLNGARSSGTGANAYQHYFRPTLTAMER